MLDNFYEKYGKTRVYFIIVFLLVGVTFLIGFLTYQMKIRFTIEGERFKYISKTDDTILFQDEGGNRVTVTKDQSFHAEIPAGFSIADKYQITYKDKVILCDNSEWFQKGESITLSDGSKYEREVIRIITNRERREKEKLPFDIQLVNQINEVYDIVTEEHLFLISSFGIPFIFIGVGFMLYPESIWRFNHALHVRGGEPTEWAIFSNVFGGLVITGLGVILPIIAMK